MFDSKNLNDKYIEYTEIKKKAKKWGKIGGIIGVAMGALICLLIMSGTELNAGTLVVMIFLVAGMWIGYKELGKCGAWGNKWLTEQSKKGNEPGILLGALIFFIGFCLRIKYASFGKQIKKQLKNK